jgi:hypothetical protein
MDGKMQVSVKVVKGGESAARPADCRGVLRRTVIHESGDHG